LTDAQGKPTLDEATLTRVLALFAQGKITAVDAEYPAPAQDGIAVGWASGYLRGDPPSVRVEAMPGLRDPSATLVDGWVWSVASADVEKQKLAFDLAAWLTAEEFVDGWAESLGYLPPHTTAGWDGLLNDSYLVPPAPIQDALLPVLDEAVTSVLNGASPEAAARAAVEQLQ
jgi:ABC-type glycerol-3-phosphate transport system substrate-binding protein